jgi:hypothetical protein
MLKIKQRVKVETGTEEHIGVVILLFSKTETASVKILEVIKGDRNVGDVVRFNFNDCIEFKGLKE